MWLSGIGTDRTLGPVTQFCVSVTWPSTHAGAPSSNWGVSNRSIDADQCSVLDKGRSEHSHDLRYPRARRRHERDGWSRRDPCVLVLPQTPDHDLNMGGLRFARLDGLRFSAMRSIPR